MILSNFSAALQNGYPKENIRVEKRIITIGHKGKNSLRADVVVYDLPFLQVKGLDLDVQREHALLVAEIKRDNKDAEDAKTNQLKPALLLLPSTRAVGIYWDDIERRLFHKSVISNQVRLVESPIAFLPQFGNAVKKDQLRYSDLKPSPDLIGLFSRIEDAIHHYIVDKSARYQVMMQLLIVKMHDEKSNKRSSLPLTLQDFSVLDVTEDIVKSRFDDLLQKGLNLYQRYLPDPIPLHFILPGAALMEISKYLAPVNLLGGDPDVIQGFYMYFAKQLYKWDLAQYFTPYEVVDFIVRVINPQYGEIIKDPACGSADFLTCAYRYLSSVDDQAGDRVWGADSSKQAVQISILNMLLNDDGKSNIREEDSLVNVKKDENKYDILLCNPPFGVRILEKRKTVLANFDLGKEREQQEVGILFTELCVRQAKPGGRIAIILPNGYLGNRSEKYKEFREWLLKYTYLVGVTAFPRFTFKKSGADVSASAVFLQKRERPLASIHDDSSYPVHMNLLESVGWEIGNKKAKKVYKREPETGAIVYDKNNEPVLDADFDKVLLDLWNSPAASKFSWLTRGKTLFPDGTGWAVTASQITQDNFVSLDPKRHNRKYLTLIDNLRKHEYVHLGDICTIIPEGFRKQRSVVYRYIQLQDIHERTYEYSEKYAWELPGRAKHLADPGDIFIAKIWGSVNKWMIAGSEVAQNPTVVTNGCYRLKLKENCENYLVDLVFALSSEFYRVQMRASATGSDGLADISDDDLLKVIIPVVTDEDARVQLSQSIASIMAIGDRLENISDKLLSEDFESLNLPQRRSNFSQV